VPHRQTGVSLIEALIAVLIASFGVLGLARFQGELFNAHALAGERTTAQLAARDALEAVVAALDPAHYEEGTDAVPSARGAFERTWRVSATAAGDVAAQADVLWSDSRSRPQRVVLATLIAPEGAARQAQLLAAHTALPGGSAGQSALSGEPPWSVTVAALPRDEGDDEAEHDPPGDAGEPPLTAHSIGGAIVLVGRAALKHVSITASDGAACALDAASYRCTVPHGWSGTVTVSSVGGQTVQPASRAYERVAVNLSGRDYVVSK
jgi:Tfp pilus assembly protein PilV